MVELLGSIYIKFMLVRSFLSTIPTYNSHLIKSGNFENPLKNPTSYLFSKSGFLSGFLRKPTSQKLTENPASRKISPKTLFFQSRGWKNGTYGF